MIRLMMSRGTLGQLERRAVRGRAALDRAALTPMDKEFRDMLGEVRRVDGAPPVRKELRE